MYRAKGGKHASLSLGEIQKMQEEKKKDTKKVANNDIAKLKKENKALRERLAYMEDKILQLETLLDLTTSKR